MKQYYKHIHFTQMGRRCWVCYSNIHNEYGACSSLGSINYYPAWKQYCFYSTPISDIILSQSCLLDIADFLEQVNENKENVG